PKGRSSGDGVRAGNLLPDAAASAGHCAPRQCLLYLKLSDASLSGAVRERALFAPLQLRRPLKGTGALAHQHPRPLFVRLVFDPARIGPERQRARGHLAEIILYSLAGCEQLSAPEKAQQPQWHMRRARAQWREWQ